MRLRYGVPPWFGENAIDRSSAALYPVSMEAAASGLLVSLLGPVEISASGHRPEISQQGLRALLALLALTPDRIAATSVLIDGLWQEAPSRPRELNLHARVFQLRKQLAALEPDRECSRIVTHERGYQLTLAPDELDLSRFEALADRGKRAARAGDPATAAVLLQQALGLWRGPALADVVGSSDRLAAEASRLQELRLDVCADYGDAMLAAGWHRELIGELAVVVADHPWREPLRHQLMLAYYRSGRQADALACYDEGCQVFERDLGVPPGPELTVLRRRIQQADPALITPQGALARPARLRRHVIPRQLPAAIRFFAGREAEIGQLDALLGQAPAGGAVAIMAICGTAGVGKTALALHWAHRVADRFPDGQLHVNLRGHDPAGPAVSPADAIRGFLDALGVPAGEIPDSAAAQVALYRSVLAGRRMVILLDNASDPAQVRPLLPASPGCVVLVTSRSALTGLTTADGAVPLPLGLVSRADAEKLLAGRMGQARTAAEPAAVRQIIERCASLPLALTITAARAAANPAARLAALADELNPAGDRLDALDFGDRASSVRSVFSWSLRQLSPGAGRLFRLLWLHPGADVTVPSAASLAGLPQAHARRLVAELVNANLLAEHAPGRYTCHDLLRAYAAEQASLLESAADQELAISRVLDHYLCTSSLASAVIFGCHDLPQPSAAELADREVSPEPPASRPAAIAWFQAEYQMLLAAAAFAAARGLDAYAWQIPCTLTEYFRVTATNRDWARLNEAALAAAERLGDAGAIGRVRFSIGTYFRITGDFAGAFASLAKALQAFETSGDAPALAATHLAIAKVHFSLRAAHPEAALVRDSAAAIARGSQALAIYRQLGDATGEGRALVELANHYLARGELVTAREHCTRAIALFGSRDDQATVAEATETLGRIHFGLGQYPQAISCYLDSLRRNAEAGIIIRPPHVLDDLGDAYLAVGNLAAAEAVWQEVVDLGIRQEQRKEIPTWRRDRVLAKLQRLAAAAATASAAAADGRALAGPT